MHYSTSSFGSCSLCSYWRCDIMTLATLHSFSKTSSFLLVRIYGNGTVDPGKTHFGKYIFSATVQFLFVGAFLGNVVFGVFTTLQPEIGEQIFYKLLVDRYRPAQEEN